MAQAINCPAFGHFISRFGNIIALADQTTNSAVQSLNGTCRWFFMELYLKTFVVGTGVAYPIFSLEVADDLAFTTNIRRIAQDQAQLAEAIGAIPGAVPGKSSHVAGFSPDAAKGFWRLKVLTNGTSTCVYDVIVAAA